MGKGKLILLSVNIRTPMEKNIILVCVALLGIVHISIGQQSNQDSLARQKIMREAKAVAAVEQDSVIVPQVRKSPMAVAKYIANDMYIKVVYGQPYKRGRVIFGELEPYGKVWRTGANEATEITTTKDFRIGGKLLKAGTYTLFTIPNQNKWTVIVNSELGQWGAYKYNPERDIVSFEVPLTKPEYFYEAFTIEFKDLRNGAEMELLWGDTRIAFPLEFTK
jgi:hypothetical protein